MMSLEDRFQESAKLVKTLTNSPSNDELLQLYALFKQAQSGDNSSSRPGILMVEKRAKHDAWLALKGLYLLL